MKLREEFFTKVFARLCCACLAAGLLSACALTEDVVPVNYTASSDAVPITEKAKTIKLEVADNRGVYRGQIGAKVNGFGEEMAAIRSTVPVRAIVKKAIADELKARNILVDNRLVRGLRVSITAMHNNFKFGFASGSARGIVAFTVTVIRSDGTQRFVGTISEIHEQPEVMIASGENAAKSVESALAKAMKKLFENREFISALVQA